MDSPNEAAQMGGQHMEDWATRPMMQQLLASMLKHAPDAHHGAAVQALLPHGLYRRHAVSLFRLARLILGSDGNGVGTKMPITFPSGRLVHYLHTGTCKRPKRR